MNNPLLYLDGLPPFDQIEASQALPALTQTLQEARETIAQLEAIEQPTWNNFGAQLESLDERIDRVWSPISHLNSVQDSKELRDVYQQGIALLTEYHVEVGQNTSLFERFKALANDSNFALLTPAQQKIISNNIRDFRLSGAELSSSDKSRFAKISSQLSTLANQFERNVLDATEAWTKHITSADKLRGLPKSALATAAQLASERNLSGYLLTLQIPSYLAVMQHAQDRTLRREMYLAYSTRASDQSEHTEFDNQNIIDQIVSLKQEKAKLLGFSNYAELSLVTKMATSVESVDTFLTDLTNSAKPVAQTELQQLSEFAQNLGHEGELEAWDISYYSERLREKLYAFTDEDVKEYFPANKVFEGLFEIVQRLFGISIAVNAGVKTWHKDVIYFDVFDAQGEVCGGFYADIYVRQRKRGGAWMDTCIHRRTSAAATQIPVAFLTCNFSPAIGDEPALLTHDEVETLFHEFGHTLHHLLTQVDEMSVAGINGVAWDAVELPSQFLENWCWQTESLSLIAGHVETGEPLPSELLSKMRAAKNFQSGMHTLRQVEFATFDMRLHALGIKDQSVQTILDDVRDQVSVTTPPKSNRFQNSFGHIFAGGYAAGYYSYKWAEVLSADAFEAFIEEGLFNAATGQRFMSSILQRGGVPDANEMFREFRGRDPQIEPLLKHSGIL